MFYFAVWLDLVDISGKLVGRPDARPAIYTLPTGHSRNSVPNQTAITIVNVDIHMKTFYNVNKNF